MPRKRQVIEKDQFLQNTQLRSKVSPSWALLDDSWGAGLQQEFVMVTF